MARYALVIGIANYDKFTNLPKATEDAEAVAQILEQHHYTVTRLPRKLIAENQWSVNPSEKLTQTVLIQELKTFLQERSHVQEAVIYIAAHGFRVLNSLTDVQEGYLATSSSNKEGQNAIKFDDLNILISKSELASLVMLLDCCYAGSLLAEQRNLLQATQTTFNQKQNYCLIAACRDFEKAREGEKHGIFTAAVLEGLKPENANNGIITSATLLNFISQELARSGQEVTHAAQGKPINLVEYAITPSLQNSQTSATNSIEKALETIQSNFELLDQQFFDTIAQKKGRSQILHLPAATWSLILQGNYIERDQQGELLAIAERLAKFDGISLLLIRGEPGAGKTALIRWLGYELFRQGKRIFQKKSDCEFGWLDQLRNFSEQINGEHFYVIFDDIFRDDLILDELKQNEFLFPLTLIGTTRLNEDQHESLSGWEYEIKCLDVARPSEAEKTKILNKVSEVSAVKARLEQMDLKAKQRLMNSPIMLVLMLQLSESKPFDQIIADIIRNLPNSQQRPIYQIFGVICCFFQYSIIVPLEILQLCLPGFNFSQRLIQTELEGLIDTAIYAGFEGLTTIHQLIAQTAIQVNYKPRYDKENQPYSWVENPSLLEIYLRKIISNIDAEQEIQKRWLYHGLQKISQNYQVDMVNQLIQEFTQKIQNIQKESNIIAWQIWANIYQLIGLQNEQNRCIDAILITEPQNQHERNEQLSLIEKIGNYEQLQQAISQTQTWLHQHPDDKEVRTKYLALIANYGTNEQKQDALAQTQTWLQQYPDDKEVRKQYLTLVESCGNNEQKQEALAQTQTWLQQYPDDSNVRTKYLALIANYGTNEQKQEAIAQTQTWLQQYPDDLNVRRQHLTLIENCGTNEQKQEAIAQTQNWLQQHPDDKEVRTKYLALIENYGTNEQKEEAIAQTQTWLQQHPDDFHVRTKYLGLIESYGNNEQKQEAIAQTQHWLQLHPDAGYVRQQYLALVGKVSQGLEEIQSIIYQQWEWISNQSIVEQNLWEAFLPVLYHHAELDLIQAAISLALQQYSESKSIAMLIFGYFRDYLDYETCYRLADLLKNSQLPIDKWRNHIQTANFFRDYGDLDTAENLYTRTIKSAKWRIKNKGDDFLYKALDFASLNYARMLLMLEPPEYYQAIGLLKPILAKNPKHGLAHLLMAQCYQAKGKNFYTQAIDSFNNAIRFDREKNGFFWYEFGCFYWDYMDNIPKARSCFEKSLIQKTNLPACVSLAELEVEAGNFSRAKSVLQSGLDLVPITRPEKEEREKLNPRIQALQQRLGL